MQRIITMLLVLTSTTACASTAEDPDTTLAEEDLDCTTVALSDCEAEPACGLQRAQRLSADGSCYGPTTEPIACEAVDLGSNNGITERLAPDGTCWRFPSTYAPRGWTSAYDEVEAACPGFEAPACAE